MNQIERDAYAVFNQLDALTDACATVPDCLRVSERADNLIQRLDEIGRRARLKADALCTKLAETR